MPAVLPPDRCPLTGQVPSSQRGCLTPVSRHRTRGEPRGRSSPRTRVSTFRRGLRAPGAEVDVSAGTCLPDTAGVFGACDSSFPTAALCSRMFPPRHQLVAQLPGGAGPCPPDPAFRAICCHPDAHLGRAPRGRCLCADASRPGLGPSGAWRAEGYLPFQSKC